MDLIDQYLTPIKAYLYGILFAIMVALSVTLYLQHGTIKDLEKKVAQSDMVIVSKSQELQQCSDSVKAVADAETILNKKLLEAEKIAKASAEKNYQFGQSILIYRPKGVNDCEKAADVLNVYIDGRGEK